MRRDTIFRMASTTKPVAVAAAMVLLDECRLRLDDPIDQWLPELADRQVLKRPDGPLDDTVPARRPITVRDLLTSTFGLGLAGALTLRLEPVALTDVLPAALDTLPGSPPQVLAHVATQGLATTPDVLADPPLLERVLANLVSNAVRHSPAGCPVTIGASALAGRVELRITDRGPGIQLPDQTREFDPFQRLGDTDNTTGIGLGLALSRGLTEAMGGTLTPEETPAAV